MMIPSDQTRSMLIRCDKDELKRRIESCIARKRNEIDILNVREFCNVSSDDVEAGYSCARVDAVYVRRFGNRGHVKISKACNEWGPQTIKNRLKTHDAHQPPNSSVKADDTEATDKRLQNPNLRSVSKDIYKRLKTCENDLLILEKEKPSLFQN
ncbi:hypothetical protein CHUAL_014144 [Chamberlinius hualienensis]